jgi:8-oxo-dGTP pyrophosphatase MutT (NUDIX family)
VTDSIASATLILVRDVDPRFEVLVIERATTMSFAAGALVFPGGRVDPDDRLVAADPALIIGRPDDTDDAAARVCAIRETLEEAGILIGCDRDDVPHWRDALHRRMPLSGLLRDAGARLDLGALTPFARWNPKLRPPSYDTRFYVARADADHVALADGSESTHAEWLPPAAAIAAADEGRASMLFPTRRNLERLDSHASVDLLIQHALSTPVTTITPRIVDHDGEAFLIIPEGLGYPVVRERLSTAIRK